jgi:hypothetical protein
MIMTNYIIPTSVVDNFFSDPKQVVDFANQQEYGAASDNTWPGKRTVCLSTINYNFYDLVAKKLIALYYPENHSFTYQADMHFQKVAKSSIEGWVHSDMGQAIVTAIVYLNSEYDPNSGTSIYETPKIGIRPIHKDKKEQFIKGDISNVDGYRKENNDQFEEVIALRNKYNRLIAFDAHQYHAAQSFANTEERLTLIIFLKQLHVDAFPIQRCMQII